MSKANSKIVYLSHWSLKKKHYLVTLTSKTEKRKLKKTANRCHWIFHEKEMSEEKKNFWRNFVLTFHESEIAFEFMSE